MREIIIDVETTGLDHKRGDRIIELACVELLNHVATGGFIQFYCSTDKQIGEDAFKIHGLSNSFLSKFPTFEEQAQSFLNFIKQDKLIIHNAEFDIGFINNELKLIGLNHLNNNVIDTVLLARKKLNTRIANLDYLCKRFSIDLSSRKTHGALKDCQLLSEVYLELLGGKQTVLEFFDNKTPQEDNIVKKQISPNKVHKIEVTHEEKNIHKKTFGGASKFLWKTSNY